MSCYCRRRFLHISCVLRKWYQTRLGDQVVRRSHDHHSVKHKQGPEDSERQIHSLATPYQATPYQATNCDWSAWQKTRRIWNGSSPIHCGLSLSVCARFIHSFGKRPPCGNSVLLLTRKIILVHFLPSSKSCNRACLFLPHRERSTVRAVHIEQLLEETYYREFDLRDGALGYSPFKCQCQFDLSHYHEINCPTSRRRAWALASALDDISGWSVVILNSVWKMLLWILHPLL